MSAFSSRSSRSSRTIGAGSLVVTAAVIAALISACDSQSPGAESGAIKVEASDSACQVSSNTGKTGNLTFEVTNKGNKITEFYLYAEGDRIMGEVENIAPGLTRRLIVEVPEGGKYQATCKPGMIGNGIRADFTVSGGTQRQAATNEKIAAATASYARFVANQTNALVEETQKFVDAVKAGSVDDAKNRYARTRVYYERIEPVAEKFGDLDPAIDAREADLEQGQQFTGFHRLEKDLWSTGLQSDSAQIADKLLADVKDLVTKSTASQLSGLDLANGAKGLLDEVATKKITGEEEAFSHTDLWDFQANIEGSKGAISALRPVLQDRNAELVSTLDKEFGNVEQLLSQRRVGDGFVLYGDLTQDQIKQFSAAVDALSEPLSKVAEVVAN